MVSKYCNWYALSLTFFGISLYQKYFYFHIHFPIHSNEFLSLTLRPHHNQIEQKILERIDWCFMGLKYKARDSFVRVIEFSRQHLKIGQLESVLENNQFGFYFKIQNVHLCFQAYILQIAWNNKSHSLHYWDNMPICSCVEIFTWIIGQFHKF